MAGYYDEITIHKVRSTQPTVITALLSNQRHIVPCDTAGNVQSHTNAFTFMRIWQGALETTTSWVVSRVDSSGVSTMVAGNRVALLNMTEDVAYTDITASRSGYQPLTRRMYWVKSRATVDFGSAGSNGSNGSNGTNGMRGTVNIAASTSSNAWSNDEAAAALSGAGFGAPQNRDIVTLYNPGTSFTQTRFYLDGAWLVADSYLNGNLVLAGTMSADRIVAGTITADLIRSGSVTSMTPLYILGNAGDHLYPFNMAYPGYALAIIVSQLNFPTLNQDGMLAIQFDNQQVVSFWGNQSNKTGVHAAALGAGNHTLRLGQYIENNSGPHILRGTLLRTYA